MDSHKLALYVSQEDGFAKEDTHDQRPRTENDGLPWGVWTSQWTACVCLIRVCEINRPFSPTRELWNRMGWCPLWDWRIVAASENIVQKKHELNLQMSYDQPLTKNQDFLRQISGFSWFTAHYWSCNKDLTELFHGNSVFVQAPESRARVQGLFLSQINDWQWPLF